MKVTKYKKSDKTGPLVAYFNIIFKTEWGGFYVNDMKLWMKDGRRWVSSPDRKYENEHGEVKYAPHCGMVSRESNEKFQEEVIKAIEEFCSTNNAQAQQGPRIEKGMALARSASFQDSECPF